MGKAGWLVQATCRRKKARVDIIFFSSWPPLHPDIRLPSSTNTTPSTDVLRVIHRRKLENGEDREVRLLGDEEYIDGTEIKIVKEWKGSQTIVRRVLAGIELDVTC